MEPGSHDFNGLHIKAQSFVAKMVFIYLFLSIYALLYMFDMYIVYMVHINNKEIHLIASCRKNS